MSDESRQQQQQKWPMSSQFIFKRSNNIVQNPTLVQAKHITNSNTQNLLPLHKEQPKPSSVIPTTHYLTVSSEDTTSTFTELDGEDLVDVDYISDYSVDLSNDDDDEVCLCYTSVILNSLIFLLEF